MKLSRPVATLAHLPGERVFGTLRRDCLDHLIVMGERHARAILAEYVRYYNEERTHQALGADSPMPREPGPAAGGRIVSFEHLSGLHHSYCRMA